MKLMYWMTKHGNIRVVMREFASVRQVRKAVEYTPTN